MYPDTKTDCKNFFAGISKYKNINWQTSKTEFEHNGKKYRSETVSYFAKIGKGNAYIATMSNIMVVDGYHWKHHETQYFIDSSLVS